MNWSSRCPGGASMPEGSVTLSQSSSRAHSRRAGVWHTLAWVRPVSARWLYACHSSVYTAASSRVCSSTTGCRVWRSLWRHTCSPIASLSRPTTPAAGGRLLSQVPWPFTLLARRLGGSSGRTAISALAPDGVGKDVEHRSTRPATVVHNRCAMPVMRCLTGWNRIQSKWRFHF